MNKESPKLTTPVNELSLKKGLDAERELAEILEKEGINVIRIPQSGRNMPLPDMLIAANGFLFGIEVKSINEESKKFYAKDFDGLLEWYKIMKRAGVPARAFLAVKLINKWLFREINIITKEVSFPSKEALELKNMIALLKMRRLFYEKIDCTIRLMGRKPDVYEIFYHIKTCLETKGYKLKPREYVMYKDKRTRTEVDPNRIRIYISIAREKKINK